MRRSSIRVDTTTSNSQEADLAHAHRLSNALAGNSTTPYHRPLSLSVKKSTNMRVETSIRRERCTLPTRVPASVPEKNTA